MDRLRFLVPLIVFLLLVVILAFGFGLKDPHFLPSELINRPFPEFSLKALHDEDSRLTIENVKGEVSLVNVWATWCPACVVEHPLLVKLALAKEVRLIGINYKDDPPKARKWLQEKKDPYEFVIVDQSGKLGIDLGVYGAPETFVVDAGGVIQYRHAGAITPSVWEEELEPLIEHLRQLEKEKNVGADSI